MRTGITKILMAEDDEDDRGFFIDFLQHRTNLQVVRQLENGEELINFLHAVAPDLPDTIILDQNMPRLNGLQTLTALKQNERFASIPVLIYSTYINDHLVADCLQNGAAMLSMKPGTSAGYVKMMDDFLANI